MRDSDINDVMAIEAEAFSVPWTRDHFLQELDLPEFSNLIVAEAEGLSGAMAGYACYSLIVDEAHITNFAVRDIYRRKGIGEQLLHHLLDRATRQGARRATSRFGCPIRPPAGSTKNSVLARSVSAELIIRTTKKMLW